MKVEGCGRVLSGVEESRCLGVAIGRVCGVRRVRAAAAALRLDSGVL